MFNCCSLTGSLSVGQGERGKSLEFTWEGTSLGIRVEGDTEYQFVDLGAEGGSGRDVQLQVSDGYIQWKYEDEEEWKNLIAISELKGDRGLDGKSAYELWIENGNEGTVDDFLLSLKGKDGEKGEQGLPGRDGTNGVDGKDGVTPNITIGTVTTLEPGQQATVENVGTLENPIFDFGIPKGEDGTGGGSVVKINDTTISKDEVWSSAKTEDFVLTNTDTVWTEVSGENLSIDYTKEGYLREVEIWGNTIQNEEDLSDIRHLGELYVDDEGREPILDGLGREQYKIEIESCNSNLFDGVLESGSINAKGEMIANVSLKRTKNYIYINPELKYVISVDSGVSTGWVTFYDVDKKFISRGGYYGKNVFTIPSNAYYMKFVPDGECEGLRLNISNVSNYTPHQSNKTTILLPCQLMKVGDVCDRLYWDSEKGKYVVEKNIGFSIIKSSNANPIITEGFNTVRFRHPLENVLVNKIKTIAICNRLPSKDSTIFNSDIEGITSHSSNSEINFRITKEKLESIDNIGFNKWLNDEETIVYYEAKNIELIETNITEQILLPCYIDKTHVFVTGGIDGSIKCKVPLDGGQAILSLSEENKELKEVNQEQDELINISLCATDEMFMMIEPLLVQNYSIGGNEKMVEMYVAMVQRGLKKIEDVPVRYREQVIEILNKLED